jgi:hypothetical protein
VWAALFSIGRWISLFLRDPANIDFRYPYYAAVLGIQQGWAQIYNQGALSALIAEHLTGEGAIVNSSHTFINPPLLAWMMAPLAVLPYSPAYVAWTLIGVAAIVYAWSVVRPFHGLAGVTVLLIAFALWPVHYSLVLGQPLPEILVLVAGAWWLIRHDRPLLAGVLLALATALKPQDVILVPFVLLIGRHGRVFLAWAVTCALLAVLFIASLGAHGVVDFWSTTVEVEGDPWHRYWTWAFVAGPGLPALALEAGVAVAALAIAWRRRADLELLIALGLLGSVLSAVHAHETDASMFVLAAWLLLRSEGFRAARLWLLLGIIAVQTMSIGLVWPIFTWGVLWLLLLAFDPPLPAPPKMAFLRGRAQGAGRGARTARRGP